MKVPSHGEIFLERYRIDRMLGVGGFATALLAEDLRLNRKAVLKILSPDSDGTYPTTVTARFRREAQIFASLDHPHIVTLYDHGQTPDGLLYMVFEHVDGPELGSLLEHGALPPDIARHMVLQLLDALREAHRLGALHRDLKPANILVHSYGNDAYRVKLIDFGIAKDIAPDATRITKTGNVVGTLRYMAPEQVFGDPLTPATDLFCLGMVAWEMLMGRPLIGGADRKEMLQQHAHLKDIQLDAPADPALRDAILRALQIDPAQRFASANAMLTAIRTPRVGTPQPPTVATSPTAPPAPPVGSRQVAPAAIIFGIAALVAVLVVGGWLATREEAPAAAPPKLSRDVTALTAEKTNLPTTELEAESEPEPPPASKCERPPPFHEYGRLGPTLGGKMVSAYIPKRYDPKDPPGLVLALHRRLRSGMEMLKYTEVAEYAERHNWIVIAPDSPVFADWTHDPQLGFDALEVAISQLCIDRTVLHILADEGGVSYGHRVSCHIPVSSMVASFGPGGLNQCAAPNPFPYLRLYTLQDTFHPKNGLGCKHEFIGDFGSWDAIADSLQEKMQCDGGEMKPWTSHADACSQTVNCPEPLVFCAFDGGHRWPASPSAPNLIYNGCDDPTTTAPMMAVSAEFMANHGRKLSPEEIRAMDEVLSAPPEEVEVPPEEASPP